MRFFIVFVLFTLLLSGNEIKRMESIVTDITKLRTQIKELEYKLQKSKKALKIKEKVIKSLTKKKVYIKPKKIIRIKKCKVVADKPNGFPKLTLKDKFKR